MTNGVQSKLLSKLVKIAFNGTNSKFIHSTRSCYNSTITISKFRPYLINLVIFKHSYILNNNLRQLSTANGDKIGEDRDTKESSSDYDDCQNTNSSFSYQRQHRRSYEHKKSNFDKKYADDRNAGQDNKLNGEISFQMNHYQRLNVEPDADQSSIKSAYYSLSKIYHPDVVGIENANAAENFRLITESYDILSNPEQRETYDRELNDKSRVTGSNFDWTSTSSHPNKDFKIIFKSKDNESFFRFKQDSALEEEKRKNPRKFQAGSFGGISSSDLEDENYLDQRIYNLNRRMNLMKKSPNGKENDFYRIHMIDSIHRKRDDLLEAKRLHPLRRKQSDSSMNSERVEIVSLVLVFCSIVSILIIIVNIFVDIDIADYLDRKLEYRLISKEENKDTSDAG